MEFSAHVARAIRQGLLDMHVDVFQFRVEREAVLLDILADLAQGLFNLPALVGGQQASLGEHLRVGRRSGDIMHKQAAIEAHTFGELLDAAIGRLGKNSTPHLLRQIGPRSEKAGLRIIDNCVSLNDLRRVVNEIYPTHGRFSWW